MTPKEKAKQLVNDFFRLTPNKDNLQEILIDQEVAKQSALICIYKQKEIIEKLNQTQEIWDKRAELINIEMEIENL